MKIALSYIDIKIIILFILFLRIYKYFLFK